MRCENVYQPKSAIHFLLLISSEDPVIEALLRHENRHPISNHHNMVRTIFLLRLFSIFKKNIHMIKKRNGN